MFIFIMKKLNASFRGYAFLLRGCGGGRKKMTEIIVVGALVGLALVFLTRKLYNNLSGNSTCCGKGTVCLKKKKTDT